MKIWEYMRQLVLNYILRVAYDVSLEQLVEIKKKGADILIIEKEGVVELLIPHADKYGFALCYTKGFLTDNAKKLCELASNAGGNIAISDVTGEENAILCGMQDKLRESNRLRRYLEELEALRIKYNLNP